MNLSWDGILDYFDGIAPVKSTNRRILQILGIVCILQGMSVVFLTSKFGALLGVASIAIGALLLMVVPLRSDEESEGEEGTPREDPIGLRIIDSLVAVTRGARILVLPGIAVVAGVVIHDAYLSVNPGYGDIDMLAMLYGFLLIVFPFIYDRFRVEAAFALVFMTIVIIILVIPLAFLSTNIGSQSSLGNWYVHELLAAPLVGILNLLGISASSAGEYVTITFNDGSLHTLGISTACAGLYSTSIFLSAFVSFVLIFERLPLGVTAVVLGVGLLAAYSGNLLRMVVIMIVGYYQGIDALLWAHRNVGWMVFLLWSAIFWFLVMRYAEKWSRRKDSGASPG